MISVTIQVIHHHHHLIIMYYPSPNSLFLLLIIHMTISSVICLQSLPSPPTLSSPTSQPSRRTFRSGFYQIEAPNLSRSGPSGTPPSTPPEEPRPVIYNIVTRAPSGFRPITSINVNRNHRNPVINHQRPAPPVESLDYGRDIITIHDLQPSRSTSLNRNDNPSTSSNSNNNSGFVRTVSSVLQVSSTAANKTSRTPNIRKGKVFDDVIYDYPGADENFNAQESNQYKNVYNSFVPIRSPNVQSSHTSGFNRNTYYHHVDDSNSDSHLRTSATNVRPAVVSPPLLTGKKRSYFYW